MTDPPSTDVLLVLPRAALRPLMRGWLVREGCRVHETPPSRVDELLAAGAAGVVVTSHELEGEWEWSRRHGGEVLVLAVPHGVVAPRR